MVRTELVLLGTGHITAATIPWFAPRLLFHRRVCGFKDGWGTRTSPPNMFLTLTHSIFLLFSFFVLKRERWFPEKALLN